VPLDEQTQHGVQTAHGAGPLSDELVMEVDQQPQHDPVLVFAGHGVQRRVAEGDDRRRTGVVGVAPVDPPGVSQPDPGRQLRGHIDDVSARPDELLAQ
jgi:hypothetical protein